MAGSDRPPEQVIRDWLEEHGSATVGLGALEQTWGLPRLDAGDRRRIARALEAVGVVVDPPLGRVSKGDELRLSLRPEPEPEPVVAQPELVAPVPEHEPEPPPQPAAAPVRPRVASLGLAAAGLGLMVMGALGPWAKNIFVTDYGLDRDGPLVLATAAIAAVALAVHVRRGTPRLPMVTAALGALAIGIVAADFRDIVDDTFVEPAWGLYVTAAGATMLVALSMSLLVRQD